MLAQIATPPSPAPITVHVARSFVLLMSFGLSSGSCRPRRAGLALFHRLERPRPVALEQARERAVGEKPAARLAARAVVDLVLGVNDTLHRRAAHRAGLAIAAVHGHPLAKRGDVLGKSLDRVAGEPLRPLGERAARRLEEPRDLRVVELAS